MKKTLQNASFDSFFLYTCSEANTYVCKIVSMNKNKYTCQSVLFWNESSQKWVDFSGFRIYSLTKDSIVEFVEIKRASIEVIPV